MFFLLAKPSVVFDKFIFFANTCVVFANLCIFILQHRMFFLQYQLSSFGKFKYFFWIFVFFCNDLTNWFCGRNMHMNSNSISIVKLNRAMLYLKKIYWIVHLLYIQLQPQRALHAFVVCVTEKAFPFSGIRHCVDSRRTVFIPYCKCQSFPCCA